MTRWSRRLAAFLLTLALLWLLWRQLEPGALPAQLRQASPGWLAVGAALYLGLAALRSLRYGVLLPRRHLGLKDLLPLTLGVSLLGNTLPARGGEVSFVLLARSGHGVRAADSVAALGVARLLDLVSVAAWFVPLALLSLPHLPATTDWPIAGLPTGALIGIVAAAVLAAALAVGALAASGGGAARALRRLAVRRGWSERPAVERAVALAEDGADAIAALRVRRVLAAAMALSLACWLVTFAWQYAFTKSLGPDIGFPAFVVGVTFAVLSKALPTPTLGGHGAAEAGWSVGFALVGWPAETAIATGLAVGLLNMIVVGGLGLPALAWLRARPIAC